MGSFGSQSLRTGSQGVVWVPKTLSGFHKVNYFPKITKILFAFFFFCSYSLTMHSSFSEATWHDDAITLIAMEYMLLYSYVF